MWRLTCPQRRGGVVVLANQLLDALAHLLAAVEQHLALVGLLRHLRPQVVALAGPLGQLLLEAGAGGDAGLDLLAE